MVGLAGAPPAYWSKHSSTALWLAETVFGALFKRVSCVVLVLGTPLGAIAGSDAPPRVRVLTEAAARAQGPRVVGTLVELNDHEIVLQRQGASTPSVFPRSAIARLEISAGTRRWRNMFIGAAVLAAAGAVVVLASGDSGHQPAVGALAAAPLGACLGAVVPAGEAWREIQTLHRAQASARGVAFRISVRF